MVETHPKKRLIGYARVSTYGQTLDSQLEQLHAAGCSGRNIYREKVTGARPDRRELNRMLGKLAPGDLVTVTRIDRMPRSTFDLFGIVKRIVDAKAQFRSLAEPWADTGTSTGRLMIAVLGGLADVERDLIRHPHRRRPQPGAEARAANGPAAEIDGGAEGRSAAAARAGRNARRTRAQLRCRQKHDFASHRMSIHRSRSRRFKEWFTLQLEKTSMLMLCIGLCTIAITATSLIFTISGYRLQTRANQPDLATAGPRADLRSESRAVELEFTNIGKKTARHGSATLFGVGTDKIWPHKRKLGEAPISGAGTNVVPGWNGHAQIIFRGEIPDLFLACVVYYDDTNHIVQQAFLLEADRK
jgi:DNA invertase Pin-like site-specific DNA recombinase